MTNHIDPDKVRELIKKWRGTTNQTMHRVNLVYEVAADDLESLLTPKPRTLADMTPAEREACRWMQCEVAETEEYQSGRGMILSPGNRGLSTNVISEDGGWWPGIELEAVTPLPHLPRLVWPASEPGEETPTPEVAPKVLITEEDYKNASLDTVVKDTTYPRSDVWDKWYENEWRTTTRHGSGKSHTNAEMADTGREVIWAPEVQA